MRLQKYLAACGVASRRRAEHMIQAGRVAVNGEPAVLGMSVDPARDAVTIEGRPVRQDERVYILLNKPAGVVSTVTDTHGRPTVIECLDGVPGRVFPVGRLDLDVEGALILTNDGELTYRLTHPKFRIDKVYLAWVAGHVTPDKALAMEQGVQLEDGFAQAQRVVIQLADRRGSRLELVMQEGRKREVKRLCAHVGHPVKKLQRTAVASVKVGGLPVGAWRYLKPAEIDTLRRLAGLAR